jgi:hypothetical protein
MEETWTSYVLLSHHYNTTWQHNPEALELKIRFSAYQTDCDQHIYIPVGQVFTVCMENKWMLP